MDAAMLALRVAVFELDKAQGKDRQFTPERMPAAVGVALTLYCLAANADETRDHVDLSQAFEIATATLAKLRETREAARFWRDVKCALIRSYVEPVYNIANRAGSDRLIRESQLADEAYFAVAASLGIEKYDAETYVDNQHMDDCPVCMHNDTTTY